MVAEYVCVPDERVGLELDEFLCLLYPEWGKGYLRRQVHAGRVKVDGMPALPSQRLRSNQVLVLDIDEDEDPPPVAPRAPRERVPILHEDEHTLVVNKPSGLAVEPERWHRERASLAGEALAIVLEREHDIGDEFRLRIVHRVDKGTSGAVLLAKDLETERALRRAFEAGTIEKRYLALVEGEFPLDDGEVSWIDRPIAPEGKRGNRMCVRADGKASRTAIRVVERFRAYTLLECRPRTGRTHQIRVHLAAEGFPLAVDPLYGRRDQLMLSELKAGYRPKKGRTERPLIDRLTLHAAEIGWGLLPGADGSPALPAGGAEAPLTPDFVRTLKQLAKVRPPRNLP